MQRRQFLSRSGLLAASSLSLPGYHTFAAEKDETIEEREPEAAIS